MIKIYVNPNNGSALSFFLAPVSVEEVPVRNLIYDWNSDTELMLPGLILCAPERYFAEVLASPMLCDSHCPALDIIPDSLFGVQGDGSNNYYRGNLDEKL